MRILITGFVVFVIWSFFSTWLYVDVLKPAMKKPVAVQTIPETTTNVSDSLARLNALMPKDLMICFEFDNTKFITDPQIENSLAEFKSWLDKYPGSMLSVTGHTDLVGTQEYNQALGLKRALVIQKYLKSKGFPPERMITGSKGEDQPIADYLTPEGRAKNRRTEISIKK
jgi:outer membrane protein OmpA-like peptidoglycan-associated protein